MRLTMNKPSLPVDKQLEMFKLSSEINHLKTVRLIEKSINAKSRWRFFSLSTVVIFSGITAVLVINPYKPVEANIPPLPAQVIQKPIDINPAQLSQIIDAVKASRVTETRFVNIPANPVKTKAKHTKVKKQVKQKAFIAQKFIPEIDRACPENYELRQPGVCYSSTLKKIIFL